jgi:hypothetical protein
VRIPGHCEPESSGTLLDFLHSLDNRGFAVLGDGRIVAFLKLVIEQ